LRLKSTSKENTEDLPDINQFLKKIKTHPYPRIYLDTNVLLSAILESEPQWRKRNPAEYENKKGIINSAKKLYEKKESFHILTSTFAIAEFMAKARTQPFGCKSYETMVEIVNDKILPPNLEIVHNVLAYPKSPRIDQRWKQNWLFAEVKLKGEAIDENGKSLGGKSFSYLLDIWGGNTESWFGGVPPHSNLFNFNPRLCNIEVSEYSAPAFEIMLFYEASKVSLETGLQIADSIHILCSRGNASILATNDGEMLKKYEQNPKLFGIKVQSTQELIEALKE
jgi:hypothetical protein